MKTPVFSEKFYFNLIKIFDSYQLIQMQIIAKSLKEENLIPFDKDAFIQLFTKLWSDPEKIVEHQIGYMNNYLKLFNNIALKMTGHNEGEAFAPLIRDGRFRDNAWNDSIYFDFIKQSYLMSASWIQNIVNDVDFGDPKVAKKMNFYTKLCTDALSPTNFALTNPMVLEATLESEGDNLVRGMQKLLEDVTRSKRLIDIETTDKEAFEVGINIATTKGKVVYQNDLMQLISYEPLCDEIYQTPILIIPPWINKFYILDLKQENSYVRWLLEQNYNVYIISWVNPDKELSNKDFEDYMMEGPYEAMNEIKRINDVAKINIVGYCLGGTLLTCLLAYLAAKGDDSVESATFFTTLVDFSDAGELAIFTDEKHQEAVEKQTSESGYFDGCDMSATFNMLRSNDMIWNFFINNYLLGKNPFPFDLLYWNSDSTRLTRAMHSFYIRNMYQQNLLAKKNGIKMKNVNIDVTKIKVPCYILATFDDHIVPWKSSYNILNLFSGNNKFVLSSSGHIAGVINHPNAKKYCYWVNDTKNLTQEEWLDKAVKHEGSWWLNWNIWQKKLTGKKIPATPISAQNVSIIEDAPGSYVKKK